MERIRAYYDGDRYEKLVPTSYKTKQNQNELFCSICGDRLYVDELIFADVRKAIEETEENPFLCENCLNEYEEMAYQH